MLAQLVTIREGRKPEWGDKAHSLLAGRCYRRERDTFRKSLLLLLALCSSGHLGKQLDAEASLISQRLQLERSRVGPHSFSVSCAMIPKSCSPKEWMPSLVVNLSHNRSPACPHQAGERHGMAA